MKFPLGAMTVGDILDRGLKVLFARFPTFLAINLIVQAPALLFQIIMVPALLQGDFESALVPLIVGGLGVLVLQIILLFVGMGATVYVITQEFIDNRVSVGEAFQVAFSRFGSLLGASILAGLLMLLGFIACIIPGFIVMVWFAFIAQVVIMERLGATAALGRSKELGTGFGWRIFGVLILLIIIQWVVGLASGLVAQVLPYQEVVTRGPGEMPVIRFTSYPNYILNAVIGFLVGVVAQSYQTVCVTLLYFDLRIRKEGFDLELAAQQMSGRSGEVAEPYDYEEPYDRT